jgi:hypothetical protein
MFHDRDPSLRESGHEISTQTCPCRPSCGADVIGRFRRTDTVTATRQVALLTVLKVTTFKASFCMRRAICHANLLLRADGLHLAGMIVAVGLLGASLLTAVPVQAQHGTLGCYCSEPPDRAENLPAMGRTEMLPPRPPRAGPDGRRRAGRLSQVREPIPPPISSASGGRSTLGVGFLHRGYPSRLW